jgi:hypothetical protein
MIHKLAACEWMRHLAVCTAAVAGMLCAATPSRASGHGAPAHGEAEAAEEVALDPDAKSGGIQLGEYRIRAYYPIDAQKSTVRFVLYASVSSEHYTDMQRFIRAHENKIRDQVITATRMTPLAIFDEPTLENFRRRIFLRLNRSLPGITIDDVFVSEFQLSVKSL